MIENSLIFINYLDSDHFISEMFKKLQNFFDFIIYDIFLNFNKFFDFLCRSPIYYYMNDVVSNLCKAIPDLSQTTRKECDMWDYVFKEPPQIDFTEVHLN